VSNVPDDEFLLEVFSGGELTTFVEVPAGTGRSMIEIRLPARR
jgi:hypothetical protein